MKLDYQLSKLALRDIDEIWIYTVQHWSIEQAEKYYMLIFDGIDSICRNPNMGSPLTEVTEFHRRLQVGSHMLIYKQRNNLIFIDRILHQRMDIENILSN